MDRAKRLIWHWTAGRHHPSPEELLRYHYLIAHDYGEDIDDDGDDVARLIEGVPVENNLRSVAAPAAHQGPIVDGKPVGYAAHTAGFNSWSIGLSLCGMRGAVDRRPELGVEPGPSPITVLQIRCLIASSVSIGALHGLEPVPEQMFSHYEAESIHGVDQVPAGPGTWKWNVTWLPHRPDMPKDDVGPWLREQVARWRDRKSVDLPDRWVGLPGRA